MYPKKTRKNGPVKKSKAGRVCKKTGCKQKLSIYNAEEFCHVHYRESQR
ncbi:MAG: hypothetical protein AB7S78_13430 [Candidatus Omnitrophota bacterium]